MAILACMRAYRRTQPQARRQSQESRIFDVSDTRGATYAAPLPPARTHPRAHTTAPHPAFASASPLQEAAAICWYCCVLLHCGIVLECWWRVKERPRRGRAESTVTLQPCTASRNRWPGTPFLRDDSGGEWGRENILSGSVLFSPALMCLSALKVDVFGTLFVVSDPGYFDGAR